MSNNAAVRHHLRPVPLITLGPLAARAGATAMMDISDGLVLDATRLAHASGVHLELDSSMSWSDDALFGGEDHGLLACFGGSTPLPEGFRAIGLVLARGEKAHRCRCRGAIFTPQGAGGILLPRTRPRRARSLHMFWVPMVRTHWATREGWSE